MLCSLVVLLGYVQPKCFSDILPCSIDEKGECLCVVRGNDGSCWKVMPPQPSQTAVIALIVRAATARSQTFLVP